MKKTVAIKAALAVMFATGGVKAQDALIMQTITQQTISMEYEIMAAQAAIGACTAEGFNPVVVITDAKGAVRLIMVADGGQYGFTEEARRKAYTAATLRATTAETEQSILENPKRLIPPDAQLLIVGGGAPFLAGQQLVGAIGVDGGGSPELEQKCASAGVEKLQEFLHPDPPKQQGPAK